MNKTLLVVVLCFAFRILLGQSISNSTFEDAIEELENLYQVNIYYPEIAKNQNILTYSIDQEADLDSNLDQLLKTSILDYFFYDNTHVIIGPSNLLERSLRTTTIVTESTIVEEEVGIEEFIVGDPLSDPQKDIYTLGGYVADDNLKEPLIGVTVEIVGESIGTITDEIGNFQIDLSKGEYELRLSYIGYLEKFIKVSVLGDGKLNLLLSKEAYQLEEVTISATSAESSVNRTEMGLEALSAREIKRIPALMGEADVIKTLLLLPGVSTVGEGSSGINIRGGSVDQNLILMDGISIFNASHVLGLFSLFNPDMVSQLELYKGSNPGRYGGRISSVMDVQLKEGNYNQFKGRGGIGLVSSRLTFEGPIIDEKLSFIAGMRFSFSDWMLNRVNVAEIRNSTANFYDGNLKLSARLGSKGKLVLSGYSSNDRFKFDDKFDFRWQTNAANLNFNYITSTRSSIFLKASYSSYKSILEDPKVGSAFRYANGINNLRIKPYLRLDNIYGLNFYVGAESNLYNINAGELEPLSSESPTIPKKLNPKKGLENALYVDVEWPINNLIQFNAGIRYSHFLNLGAQTVNIYPEGIERTIENKIGEESYANNEIIDQFGGFEPRASLKLQYRENQSLKLSYNNTRQYISQLFNSTSVTPVDLWQMSNQYLEPLQAHNYSMGYFIELGEKSWENSIEVFYRSIDNLIEYKDLATLFLNDHIETELIPAAGRAYGIELSFKKNIGRLTGRLSYTLSRTEAKTDGEFPKERINNNNWFPSNYDRPHDLSLISTFQFTKRTYASVNFVYSSGRPTSAPTGNVTVSNAVSVPIYGERNIYRIPAYHRLDFSYTIEQSHRKTQKWRSSWTFSVYNLYSRQNAFSVFFTQKPFQSPKANRLAVLARPVPSITYNFNF